MRPFLVRGISNQEGLFCLSLENSTDQPSENRAGYPTMLPVQGASPNNQASPEHTDRRGGGQEKQHRDEMMTEEVGKNQTINLKTKGVLAMKRKQKQCAKISKSPEKEPFLKAQLTSRGLILDGQGVSAIRAVSLIACVALIAISVVAVVALLTESCQTRNQENEQRAVYSSQLFPEKFLEETEINVFFDNRFIDP